MTAFRPEHLLDLADRGDGPCLSFYMPTHRKGPEIRQDPKRLGNLLRDARAQGEALGAPKRQLDELLAPAEALLGDEDFWNHQSEGLAMFLAPGVEVVYRSPIPVRELVLAADRFHIKPLLPLMNRRDRFLVLAVSRNQVRLFEGARFGIMELEPKGMPKSLADALWMDDPEKSLQLHTVGGSTAAGRAPAVFHGQGANEDVEKIDLTRYFREVDRGLREYVANGDTPPLVLACVEYYLPLYRQASSYPGLENGLVVPGNPDRMSAEEIHARAWELVEPKFAASERDAEARFRQGHGTGMTSADIREICTAAQNARVAELFVALDTEAWGRPSADGTGAAEIHETPRPGDVDLLDCAAVWTLRNGGSVFARPRAEVPGGGRAAAVLRY